MNESPTEFGITVPDECPECGARKCEDADGRESPNLYICGSGFEPDFWQSSECKIRCKTENASESPRPAD
jgi:hypothetical protein